MAVLINCFILCVWQFHSVRSTGVCLPVTSLAYKVTTTNPTPLSLSFLINDSMESKITTNFEDVKPIKSSPSTQDEEVSKKTALMSELLPNLGSISDNDSTLKDLIFWKQKQNVDPNIIYKDASPPQEDVPQSRTISEQYDVPKNLQNKKNNVNYNIKVISPPAVFKNLPRYLPVSQNVDSSKVLTETYKYSQNVPTFLPPYPVTAPTEEIKQKSTIAWQNVGRTSSNNEDENKYKIAEPNVQKNTVNIEHNVHQVANIAKNKDMLGTPKEKLNYDININKTPFNIDTRSTNLFDYNLPIPIKFLDTSHIQNHDILSTMSDVNYNKQKMKPPVVSTLNEKDTEIHKINDNMSISNDIRGKQITKCYSFQNIPPKFPLSLCSSAPELLPPHITTDAPTKLSEMSVIVSTYPELESHTHSHKPHVDIPIKDTENATKKPKTKFPVPYISSVTINYKPCIESSEEIMILV